MTASKKVYLLFIGVLLLSCTDEPGQVKVTDSKLKEVKSDSSSDPPIPHAPTGIKVAAYLVYADSTMSSFDVLNDKTIALWNTIIGEGDALKPSEKTKVVLTGKLDSLKVVIYNGKKKVINQQLPGFARDFESIIENTGCQEVKVIVTKHGKEVYQNNIPYECGE